MATEKSPDAVPPPAAEPGAWRLILSLGLAGLLSGLAIVTAYEWTLPAITANRARELQEAVFQVLPGVTRLQALVYVDGHLEPAAAPSNEGETVYAGYDQTGQLIGYALTGEGAGYQDTIRLLYGYRPGERQIVGMRVLDSRETPGLGDKIYKDPHFRENFRALAVDPAIGLVKKGEKTRPNQVDAITGATISSGAVVQILNRTNRRWLERLPPAAGSINSLSPVGRGPG